MRATRALPAGYSERGGISLKNNRRLLILLNLAGIPWAVLCAVFFFMASRFSALPTSGSHRLTATDLLLGLVALALAVVVTLILHELTHGVFFWLFTRARPRFGFKGAYAYAAAPAWYIPRGPFLLIGLAPLIFLSALGLLVLPLVSFPASLLLLVALIVNATGAIGDLYMVTRLAFAPRGTLIEDQGEGIHWFAPTA